MSEIEKKEGVQIKDVKEQLQEMPTNMRLFSLAMRSLYAENAVGTDNGTARRFRELRDNTRNDALVYLKVVLPVCTKFVASLEDYFQNYEALTFEDWKEVLEDIRDETRTCKEVAETCVKMHEDMLIPLKKREDEAKALIKEFKNLEMEYRKQEEEFKKNAKTKRGWAFGLAFVPVVNVIATPMLYASADADIAKALANAEQSKINGASVLVVSKTLIPALKDFIASLENAAGFFNVIEIELDGFSEKADKSLESRKKLHYMKMKNDANELKSLCQSFYSVIPAVRTDFLAIPNEGTDKNYVDNWLKKQLKDIDKKQNSTVRYLKKILDP